MTDVEGARAVAGGVMHTCVLVSDGHVRCFGHNEGGALGIPLAVDHLWMGDAKQPVAGLEGAVALASGYSHACALRRDGRVLCWGGHSSDYFVDGVNPGAVMMPGVEDAIGVTAGSAHTCALRRDGSVACWGRHSGMGLGPQPAIGNEDASWRRAAHAVDGLRDVAQIDSGPDHVCALRRDGKVACWGENAAGQLGDGSEISRAAPVEICGLDHVTQISAGEMHTCALRSDGTVACWGRNADGMLGDGTTIRRAVPVLVTGLRDAVEIAAEGNYTCARRQRGPVVCWGCAPSFASCQPKHLLPEVVSTLPIDVAPSGALDARDP